ncbi:MAG: shikimate kinase [Victivallales bacterium]|nr:shikimate kinase [Victivallales bacterium]
MNIVICGMKHCGKSTHGEFVARRLACPFIDTDRLLEQEYFRRERNPLNFREIYNLHGEEYFRRLEADVIHELIASAAAVDGKQVIALGGGVPVNPFLGGELKKLGFFVFLQNEPEVLFRRILKKGLPDFLQGADPYAKFLELCRERGRRYTELADLTIRLDEDLPVKAAGSKISAMIEEALNERQHLR